MMTSTNATLVLPFLAAFFDCLRLLPRPLHSIPSLCIFTPPAVCRCLLSRRARINDRLIEQRLFSVPVLNGRKHRFARDHPRRENSRDGWPSPWRSVFIDVIKQSHTTRAISDPFDVSPRQLEERVRDDVINSGTWHSDAAVAALHARLAERDLTRWDSMDGSLVLVACRTIRQRTDAGLSSSSMINPARQPRLCEWF